MNYEKELKRFVRKSQGFSFTVAMLVLFLITGMVSFGAEGVIKSNEELLKEVTKSKEEILELLEENEKSLTKDDLAVKELVDKGEFMVKPLWDSWQFGTAFTYSSMHSEDDGKGDGYDLEMGEDGHYRNTEYFDGGANGSNGRFDLVEQEIKEGTVEVTTGIKPKELPSIPSPPKAPTAPSIEGPSISVGGNLPTITINPIGKVEAISPSITVPVLPEVEVNPVEVSMDIPNLIDLVPLDISEFTPSISFARLSSDIYQLRNGTYVPDVTFGDLSSNVSEPIESVHITKGSFTVRDIDNIDSNNPTTITYTDVSGHTTNGAIASDIGSATLQNLAPTGAETETNSHLFALNSNNALILGEDVHIDGVIFGTTPLQAANPGAAQGLVYFDNSGSNHDFNGLLSDPNLGLTGGQKTALEESSKYVQDLATLNDPTLAFINSGTIDLDGTRLNIITNFNERDDTLSLVVNDENGKIIIGDFEGGITGDNSIFHIDSTDYKDNEEILYNKGILQNDAEYTRAIMATGDNISIVNDGEINVNGYSGIGILTDGDNIKLSVNEPIFIYGDGSAGVTLYNNTTLVNNIGATSINEATTIKVNVGIDADGNERVNSNGGLQEENNIGPNGLDVIEGVSGIYLDNSVDVVVNKYEVNFGSNVMNSVGITTQRVHGPKAIFEEGSINIMGSNNMGAYARLLGSNSEITIDNLIIKPSEEGKISEKNTGISIGSGQYLLNESTAYTGNDPIWRVNNLEVNDQSNLGVYLNGGSIYGAFDIAVNSGATGIVLDTGGIVADSTGTSNVNFTNSDTNILSRGVYREKGVIVGSNTTFSDVGSIGGIILTSAVVDNTSNITFANYGTLKVTNPQSIGSYITQGAYKQYSSGSYGSLEVDKGIGLYFDTEASTKNTYVSGAMSSSSNTVKVSNGGKAIYVKGDGTFSNTKELFVEATGGDNNIAVFHSDRTTNNGTPITTSGDNIIALYGDGDLFNAADIKMAGDNATGIYAPMGNIKNLGDIYIGEDQRGIVGTKDILNHSKLYIDNTGATTGSAIGIYGYDGANIINKNIIDVTEANGIGVYLDSGSFDNTNGTLVLKDGATGIYANGNSGGDIDLTNASSTSKRLTVRYKGIGLTVGGTDDNITGDTVYINSGPVSTGEYNIGILYTDGGTTLESNDLKVDATGDNLIYYYGDSNLENIQDISSTGENNILFYSNGATGKNSGTIDVTTKNIGVVGKGSDFENSGTINVDNTSAPAGSGDYAIGILADYDGTTSTTYKNTGLIDVISTSETSIGMASVGDGTTGDTLDNSGGTINLDGSESIAFYLKDGGSLDGSKIGDITSSPSESGAVVVSDNGNIIGDLDISGVDGKIGLYAQNDSGTTAGYQGTVTVGDSVNGNAAIAMYYDLVSASSSAVDIDSNLTVGSGGVGLYLNNDTTTSKTVTYNGEINVGDSSDVEGIGVYLTGDTTLKLDGTSGGKISINSAGGTAFYIGEGATLDTTPTNKTEIEFNEDGSLFFVEKSAVTYNFSDFNIIDNGHTISLGTVAEGFFDIAPGTSTIGGTKGYSSVYGVIHTDSGTSINSTSSDAIGLYAQGYQNAYSFIGGLTSTDIEIVNDGSIGLGGDSSIGIAGISARVENNGGISVGNSGFGIYLDEDTSLTNGGLASGTTSYVENTGDITLGNDSVGIYQKSSTTTGYIDNSGDISGGDRSTGLYYSGLNTTQNTNTGNITLGNGGAGLVANDSVVVTSSGDIVVGDSQTYNGQEYVSAGLVANDNSKVTSSGSVTVGDRGVVYYAEGGELDITTGNITAGSDSSVFYGKSGGVINYGGSSNTFTNIKNLFVADGIGSEVNLTGSTNYTASLGGSGIGIFARGGGIVDIGTATLDLTLNGVDGVGVYDDGDNIVSGNISVDIIGNGGIGYYSEGMAAFSNTGKSVDMTSSGDNRVGYLTNDVTTFNNDNNLSIGSGNGNIGYLLNGSSSGAYTFNNNNKQIDIGSSTTGNSVGIYLNDSGTLNVTNLGTVNTGAGNVGIYSNGDVVASGGTINLGSSSGGIYGVGNVTTSATITGGGNGSYGAYTDGNLTYTGSGITVSGDDGYGLIGIGSVDTSGSSGTITLAGDNGLGIFSGSESSSGVTPSSSNKIINTMDIVSTGLVGTAIQGINTNIDNSGDISTGIGGTGIYGEARGNNNIEISNSGNILVEASNVVSTSDIDYAVGMGVVTNNNGVGGKATLVNNATGVVEVTGNLAVGMYGSGSGSTVVNNGDIIINPSAGKIKSITGMYLIDGAQGINNGYIGTPVGADLTSRTDVEAAVGVAVYGSGSHFTNNGTINLDISNGIGVLIDSGGTFTNTGQVTLTGSGSSAIQGSEDNVITGTSGLSAPSIFNNSGSLSIGSGMSLSDVTIYNTGQISADGVVGLDGVDLILTTEADPDDIFIGSGEFVVENNGVDIKLDAAGAIDLVNDNKTSINLGDYITSVVDQFTVGNGYTGNLTFASNSLTWDYDPNTTSLQKKSYSELVGDSNLRNFTDGLDERYEDADPDSEETKLFQSLNRITNGDYGAFDAALDEMSGSEYANIQTRMKQVNEDFASGVDELMSWENLTKDNNKVALIGSRRDYEIDTAGVYDYDYFSQGAMYLNSFEDLSYGQQKGYYLGFLHDEIDFDNEGESEEEGYTLMAGVFNEHSFDTEDKTSLLTKVEVFGGYRDMERKFYVYDDTYETDGDYYTYGINLINDLSYDYRVNKHFKVVPKVGFTLGYGRFTEVEEDGDVVDLEVDDNDYIVAEPSVGIDFKATMPISETMDFVASIGTEVTYDFGTREYDNEARVRHTSADSYDLENPDEERYNLNTNARIGLEKDSFGVGAEVGYKTVGDEVYGSIDMKVKF